MWNHLSLLVVVALVGCVEASKERESDATPETTIEPTTILDATITAEQRDKLNPAVRSLLDDIEAKKAAGALASNYSAALAKANEVNVHPPYIEYWIILDGAKDPESHASIFLRVEKKSGRIVTCSTCYPDW